MIEDLPQLEPLPMRPEQEGDREIWTPQWRCYCCHDSGEVQPHLARLVIPGYDPSHHRVAVCQNPGCQAQIGLDYEKHSACLDFRLKASICQKLDAIGREDWKNWREQKMERLARARQIAEHVRQLAEQKSARVRDRTGDEEMAATQKHQEVQSR